MLFRTSLLLLIAGVLAMPVSPAQAITRPIAFGQSVYDAIDNTEVDSLTFTASANDRIIVRMQMCEDFGGQWCCCFDQRITVIGPDHQEMITSITPSNGNCCGCRFQLTTGQFPLPLSGTHLLLVSDLDGFGRGRYTVFLQRLNNPGRADTLTAGLPYLGTVESCGSADTFVFFGRAGHPITIEVRPGQVGSVNPRLELYGADGLAIAVPNDNVIVFTPAASGFFRVLAYSASIETGTYQILFTESPTAVTPASWGNLKVLYR